VLVVSLLIWRVRRSGLTPTVVLADAAIISVLALAQQHLVPAVLIEDSTTWMLPLACTSVYICRSRCGRGSADRGRDRVIAYGLGAGQPAMRGCWWWRRSSPPGLVAVIRGGARQADAIVRRRPGDRAAIRAEEARRADEREQHRQLHDTVLSTPDHGRGRRLCRTVPGADAQADRDLRVLQGLAGARPCRAAGAAD